MNVCAKCKKEKPLDEFNLNKTRKNGHQNYCRECSRIASNKSYARNLEYYSTKRKNLIRDNRIRITSYVEENGGCCCCGETDPIVMEFDHLRDKKFGIASGLVRLKWETVAVELDKCQILCGNCHAEKTAKEKNYYWYFNADDSNLIEQYQRKKRHMLKIKSILEDKGCIDCGERNFIVLEFDHVNGRNFDVTKSPGMSWKKIEEEISLCVVRCRNCHKRKTAAERNFYSYLPPSKN